MNKFIYRIVTDDDIIKTTHEDYLGNDKLLNAVRSENTMKLYLGLTVLCFSKEKLMNDKKLFDYFKKMTLAQKKNPLMFYAPNSQEQLEFINDDVSSVSAVVDPNRVGKSTSAWIKCLTTFRTIKCDPEWPIFKEHGIRFQDFLGPVSGGVCSYNLAKMKDPMWKEMIKKWTPDSELGIYGRTYKGKKMKDEPSWGHDSGITLVGSNSYIGFYTYEMDQGNYEGGALKWWLWDEQGKEAMFDGADRGTATTDGKHIFSLTPHKVVGRPDTGGAGWIRPLLTGVVTKGHTVKTYSSGSIHDVPDWIYPEHKKRQQIVKWIEEPMRTNNPKMLAEGRARVFGEWHTTAGLVFDEWNPAVHWIAPLWKTPPKNLTIYRGIDHGLTNPTACLWFAVDEKMNIIIFREYYARGRTITWNVNKIVEMSGNKLDYLSTYENSSTGAIVKQYEEKFITEAVTKQAMDSRSFSLSDASSGKNYGWLYQQAGLRRLIKASGKNTEHWIPMVKELLAIDPERKHLITGEMGAPRLYVFNTCTNFYSEIMNYHWDENEKSKEDPREVPVKKDDHLMNAMAYAAMIPMRYYGSMFQATSNYNPNNVWADPLQKKKKQLKPDYRRI